MRRRAFITLLGGAAAAWPLAARARAQQGERMRRIGVLVAAPRLEQLGLDRGSGEPTPGFTSGHE